MFVVAHPDDEVLGPGGTIHKMVHDFNASVHVVILGEGITSRSDERDVAMWSKELTEHRRNIQMAREAIGYQSVSVYDLPDNRFDTIALLSIIKIVEAEKTKYDPQVIFTHHGGDVNIDHQRTFEAVITACRPMSDNRVSGILTFETPSGTEWRASSDPRHFIPNYFVEISQTALDAKIQAMEKYEFERRPYPHPRSPESLRILAQRWGTVIGRSFAEAFCLIRWIDQ